MKSKTNITVDKLNELGFFKLHIAYTTTSSTFPVFYANDCFPNRIGQAKNGEWGFYVYNGVSHVIDRKLHSISGIISYIIEKSIEKGELKRSREIRNIINAI